MLGPPEMVPAPRVAKIASVSIDEGQASTSVHSAARTKHSVSSLTRPRPESWHSLRERRLLLSRRVHPCPGRDRAASEARAIVGAGGRERLRQQMTPVVKTRGEQVVGLGDYAKALYVVVDGSLEQRCFSWSAKAPAWVTRWCRRLLEVWRRPRRRPLSPHRRPEQVPRRTRTRSSSRARGGVARRSTSNALTAAPPRSSAPRSYVTSQRYPAGQRPPALSCRYLRARRGSSRAPRRGAPSRQR